MLRTLIVGFSRAGMGLHWQVLRRMREAEGDSGLLSELPVMVYDLRDVRERAARSGVVVVPSLRRARAELEPDETVIHLCTPPTARLEILRELAELGFRHILVEKPLATDRDTLRRIDELRRTHGLQLMVVAHWLDSSLTRNLRELLRSGELGGLRSISVLQTKPRHTRTLAARGHPTAFEVEAPHSLGVVLSLAGDAEVATATAGDMHVGDQVVPLMGSAHLVLRHHDGTRTEIFSDLTSPVRERRITLRLTRGLVVGHYSAGQDDRYAHLWVRADGREWRKLLPDDALMAFLSRAYRQFAAGEAPEAELELNVRTGELLSDAKALCLAGRQVLEARVSRVS
jgi:predicted dehydrogenase